MLSALQYVFIRCRDAIRKAGGLRRYVLGVQIIQFLEFVCMAGSPYFYSWIIDGAASLLTEQPAYGMLLCGIAGFLLQAGTLFVFVAYTGIWSQRVTSGVSREITDSIMARVTRIHFNNLENAKTHETIEKVRETLPSDVSSFAVRSPLFTVLWAVLSVTILSVTLARIQLWIAVLVLLSNAVQIGMELYKAKKSFSVEVNQLPEKRISGTYMNILTDRTYLKEIRLYGLKKYLLGKWDAIVKKLKRQQNLLSLKYTVLDILVSLVKGGVQIVALYLTVRMIAAGKTTVGSFLLVYQASMALANRITDLSAVAGICKNIHNHAQYWHAFDEMTEITRAENAVDPGTIEELRTENITFRYFGNERDTLHGISAHIHKGEKIAIVGANGSGKTTFVSLLNGIYQPRSGKITYNGIDADACIEPVSRRIITLTQNFGQYPYSAAENIAFGDIDGDPSPEQIKRAAVLAGADRFIEELPEKYDTLLGNLIGEGAGLSIGQWQCIALARLYVNPHAEIYILDEPTASLDANAESQIYESVLAEAKDKTLLFISHRLSVTSRMDRILVFDNGTIVEEGTHTELMHKHGLYAQMYEAQAELYRETAAVG